MGLRLDPTARELLASRRDALRTAATRCDAASAEWNRRNDELTDLAKRSRWDDELTARVKTANRGLNDAYSAWNFWQQEVRRLAADIQTEITYRRLLADVVDDDDPMFYDRSDDEMPGPVPPVPAHVDGLSITGRAPRRPTNSPAGYASGRPGPRRGEAGIPTPASPARGGAR